MNNSKITEMKKLIEQLKKANYAYYQLDEPIMSDSMEIKFLIKKFNDPKFLKYDVVQANNQA